MSENACSMQPLLLVLPSSMATLISVGVSLHCAEKANVMLRTALSQKRLQNCISFTLGGHMPILSQSCGQVIRCFVLLTLVVYAPLMLGVESSSLKDQALSKGKDFSKGRGRCCSQYRVHEWVGTAKEETYSTATVSECQERGTMLLLSDAWSSHGNALSKAQTIFPVEKIPPASYKVRELHQN